VSRGSRRFRAVRLGAAGVGAVLLVWGVWLEHRAHPLFLHAYLYAAWITALPWVWNPRSPEDERRRTGVGDRKDFREELTDALVGELDRLVVTRADRDLLRLAVRTATDGWTVRKRAVTGPSVDGQRFYEITTPPRRLTPAEAEKQGRREAVRASRYGPDAHRAEPPDGVGALALLEQDRWWVTHDKRKLRVKGMHPKHRANTLAMLRRNAVDYFNVAAFNVMGGVGALEPPDDVVDSWQRSMGNPEAAAEWLEEQPLVRKLRRLVRRDARAGLLDGPRVVRGPECD